MLNSRNIKLLGINYLNIQNPFCLFVCFYCIERQNNLGWSGPLEIMWSNTLPPVPRNWANFKVEIKLFTALSSQVFTIISKMEIPQHRLIPQCSTTLQRIFALCLIRIPLALPYVYCFLPFCCAPPGRVWLHLFYKQPSCS